MDLSVCISHCRAVQGSYSKVFSGVPDKFSFTSDGSQLLFLSSFGTSANSLYAIDLVKDNKKWDKMLGPVAQQQLSRSEQLLQERMRTFSRGITNYKYVQDGTNCSVIRRHGVSVCGIGVSQYSAVLHLCSLFCVRPSNYTFEGCRCLVPFAAECSGLPALPRFLLFACVTETYGCFMPPRERSTS